MAKYEALIQIRYKGKRYPAGTIIEMPSSHADEKFLRPVKKASKKNGKEKKNGRNQ